MTETSAGFPGHQKGSQPRGMGKQPGRGLVLAEPTEAKVNQLWVTACSQATLFIKMDVSSCEGLGEN